MVQDKIVFPLTTRHFPDESSKLWATFLSELEIVDVRKASSYWPLFLRKARVPLPMIELAYFESACAQACEAGETAQRLDGLCLNPSAQVIPIDRAAELLGKPRGVYVVYCVKSNLKVESLSLAEALCFENIQEDRVFTQAQFEEWMQIEFAEEGIDASPKSTIKKMIDEGIFKLNQGDFI
jgi:hypothetical protein